MSVIPIVFVGSIRSPWHERLRVIINRSRYMELHHVPDWVAAVAALSELTLEAQPILAIDKPLREAFFNLPKAFFRDIPRVFLNLEGGGSLSPIVEVGAPSTIEFRDSDENIILGLLDEWVGHLDRSRRVANGKKINGVAEARRLIASTVHDLRTPLAVITGYCNWAEAENCMSTNSIEPSAIFGRINQSAKSMAELIDRNLVSFELDHGRLHIERNATEIRTMFLNDLKNFEILAQNKGLDFICECEDSIPDYLLIDRCILIQSIGNLIDNAIKFTERGFIKVTTSYTPSTESMYIDVQDTGRGIPLSKQALIFDLFTHEHEQSEGRRQGRGLGLGLDNARRLARAMGGDVVLKHSTPNEGSIFCAFVNAPVGEERVRLG